MKLFFCPCFVISKSQKYPEKYGYVLYVCVLNCVATKLQPIPPVRPCGRGVSTGCLVTVSLGDHNGNKSRKRGYETFAHENFFEGYETFCAITKKRGYEKFSQGQGDRTKHFGIFCRRVRNISSHNKEYTPTGTASTNNTIPNEIDIKTLCPLLDSLNFLFCVLKTKYLKKYLSKMFKSHPYFFQKITPPPIFVFYRSPCRHP